MAVVFALGQSRFSHWRFRSNILQLGFGEKTHSRSVFVMQLIHTSRTNWTVLMKLTFKTYNVIFSSKQAKEEGALH